MRAVLIAIGALAVMGAAAPQREAAPPVRAAIVQLGAFDDAARASAARTVRRASPAVAGPALVDEIRSGTDEYVRFRAFVLLAEIDPAAAGQVASDALDDHNDRLRTAVYQWFEHHPSPAVVPRLLAALGTEQSEFVRPALTRALAASGDDARVREALTPLVLEGEDVFRGSVIEALGEYHRTYALTAITQVAMLDGPLQDDAITAIGRLGDPASRAVVGGLQATAPRELQPTISASLCLLGIDCDARLAYVKSTLAFAASTPGYEPLLRGAVHALAVLALAGHDDAMAALVDAGAGAAESVRAPIAIGVGLVALRKIDVVLRAIEARPDARPAIALVGDAFDRLSEDFEEERCVAELGRAARAAADGSPRRRAAEALLAALEY